MRILRIVLTAFLGALISAALLLPTAFIDDEGEMNFERPENVDILIGVTAFGAIIGFITGVVVSTGRWRIIGGAIAGLITHLVVCLILIAAMIVFDEPLEVNSVEQMVEVFLGISLIGVVGIVSGFACGCLSPKREKADSYTEPPPPPEHFNFH